MTQQTLRYGLTTAFRPIAIPELWDGHETITTTLLPGTITRAPREETLAREHTMHAPTQSFRVPAHSNGTFTLTREITGAVARHTTIIVEAGAHVTITEELGGSGTLALTVTLLVERDAHVEYRVVQELAPGSVTLLTHEAHVQHAEHRWLVFSTGSEHTHAQFITFAGERAVVKTHGVVLARRSQQNDIFATTYHEGSHGQSDMLVRAVVDDAARTVLHGLITIKPNAPECDSYQKSEIILLSDRATADAIPNLEIGNHQVRCSHGATIGKLDAEKLFYLTSRGIPEASAKRAITEGFVSSLLPDELKIKALARLQYEVKHD